jgi:hypothetical protein
LIKSPSLLADEIGTSQPRGHDRDRRIPLKGWVFADRPPKYGSMGASKMSPELEDEIDPEEEAMELQPLFARGDAIAHETEWEEEVSCPRSIRTTVSGFSQYSNSAALLPVDAQVRIRNVASLILQSYRPGCQPIKAVRLIGYANCDPLEECRDPDFMMMVGRARASAVRGVLKRLINNRAITSRIAWGVKGGGASQLPVWRPTTGQDRLRNRRVEIFASTEIPRWEGVNGTRSEFQPSQWDLLELPASPTLSFSDAQRQAVQALLDQEVHNENALADKVFFLRHPSRRGADLSPGERREWIGIRDQLVRPMLAAVPMNIPARLCCLLAPPSCGTKFLDLSELGTHKASEALGTIYTGRGGFVDLGHVRETCDLTEFIWTHLQGSGGALMTIPTLEGEATIIKQVPRDRWLDVAQAIANDHGLGHEIVTYDFPFAGGHNSSFSPEDLCSNFVGTMIARLAIGEGGVFSRKVDTNLVKVLKALLSQTPSETQKAFDKIKTRWVNFIDPTSCMENSYLKRRNFTRNPWKAGHPSDAKAPPWILATLGDAESFYTYKHTAGKTTPKTSFPAEVSRIRDDAKTRYGNDFDKP